MTLDELDKLAAEKIMGYYPSIFGGDWLDHCQAFIMHTEDWQPTRNIAQSFELLEKLEKPYRLSYWPFKDKEPHVCIIMVIDKDFEAGADTAALAITKAALKARGVEV